MTLSNQRGDKVGKPCKTTGFQERILTKPRCSMETVPVHTGVEMYFYHHC